MNEKPKLSKEKKEYVVFVTKSKYPMTSYKGGMRCIQGVSRL